MAASARQRKKKKQSCAKLQKRARRIKDPRKRKRALKKLPKRCRTKKPVKPQKPRVPIVPDGGTQPGATVINPPGSGTPGVPPVPPGSGLHTIDSPIAVYSGPFGARQAERLLWRAGFGPRPGQAAEVAAMGLEAAVLMLTRPSGTAQMDGPEPVVDGQGLDPYASYGHDHLWWLDRMVRSRHQLIERLALVFHDWFATSNAGVGSTNFMFDQVNLFRTHGLGNFSALVRAITQDPAMLIWLSGLDNRKNEVNENYARELMELFTLGADRGAYTEEDVREMARTMSGWTATWSDSIGLHSFRWDELNRWDPSYKTVFGQTGRFTWEDGCRMVMEHPLHPSFFVEKLWSYFVGAPPSAQVSEALQARYRDTGHEIRPVLEAILCAPELYEGPRMVKPPAVFAAGLLRGTGQSITTDAWTWMCDIAGQHLFYPPDVSGWDEDKWLDTNTLMGRWIIVNQAINGHTFTPSNSYPAESAADAVASARAFWNDPPLTSETADSLGTWAATCIPSNANGSLRAQRQNSLRMLIGMSPDHHTT